MSCKCKYHEKFYLFKPDPLCYCGPSRWGRRPVIQKTPNQVLPKTEAAILPIKMLPTILKMLLIITIVAMGRLNFCLISHSTNVVFF